MLYPLLALLLSYHFSISYISVRMLCIVVLLGISGMHALSVARGVILWGDGDIAKFTNFTELASVPRELSVGLNADSFDKFLLIIRDWYNTSTFRNGKDFIVGFQGVVPRSVWPDKPTQVHPGEWLRSEYLPVAASGWPFTAVGQWMVNFGMLGIFFGGLVAGIVYSAITERYRHSMQSPLTGIIIVILVTSVFPMGWISQTPFLYVLWTVPLYLLCIIMVSFDRRMSFGRTKKLDNTIDGRTGAQ